MTSMRVPNRRGVTIFELMILCAIIGVLAAISVPSYHRVRKMDYLPICVNNLERLQYGWLVDHPQEPGPVSQESRKILHGHGPRVRRDCPAGEWSYVLTRDGLIRCTVHGTIASNHRTLSEWMDFAPVSVTLQVLGLSCAGMAMTALARIMFWLGGLLVAAIVRRFGAERPRASSSRRPEHEGVSCPLCNLFVKRDVAVCDRCGTIHHDSCLEQAGRCAAPSCGRGRAVERIAQPRAMIRPRSVRTPSSRARSCATSPSRS